MNLRLNLLFLFTSLSLAGCETPVAHKSSSGNDTQGANGIGLTLKYYVGIFGDDQPTWGGMYYRRENLSIIAHLPTKSEFFIYVRRPEDDKADITNNLHLITEKIKDKSGAVEAKESWETISQEISIKKKSTRLNYTYLRSEFTGTRIDTDRYSKSDQVIMVVYAACLTPERPASKAVYSVAIAMIPKDVHKEERERLLNVLGEFLRKKITYFF